MKKFILISLMLLLIFNISACGRGNTKGDTVDNTGIKEQTEDTEPQSASDKELKNIIVETDFQDIVNNKRKVVVHVTNKSDKEFNGEVTVKFKTTTGRDAGFDIVFVDKLAPNSATYAIIEGDKDAVKAECRATGEFTEFSGYVSKYKYETIHTQPGNNYLTLYIHPENSDAEILVDIIKEFKTRYSKDNMLGFQVFFFSEMQEGKPDIDNAIANYTCNYSNGLSELRIEGGKTIEIE